MESSVFLCFLLTTTEYAEYSYLTSAANSPSQFDGSSTLTPTGIIWSCNMLLHIDDICFSQDFTDSYENPTARVQYVDDIRPM